MKILFDQGTPVPLRRSLTEHTVDTAYELGWADLANGDLLAIAEQNGYDDHGFNESTECSFLGKIAIAHKANPAFNLS
jgi:hypothetical protein